MTGLLKREKEEMFEIPAKLVERYKRNEWFTMKGRLRWLKKK